MSFDGRSDAQMSLVKLLLPTKYSHIQPNVGPAKVFCGHGESLAKVFVAKNGHTWKKEF